MQIRPLLPGDDPAAVSRVYEQSWQTAYRGIIPSAYLDAIPAGNWCRAVTATDRHTLVLVSDGQIVGTSAYCAARSEQMAGWGEVISLYLLPGYCRRGLGTGLLRAAVAGLAQLGFADVYLWVLAQNQPARRFYQKFGFADSGIWQRQCIGGRSLRELIYTCHLSPNSAKQSNAGPAAGP